MCCLAGCGSIPAGNSKIAFKRGTYVYNTGGICSSNNIMELNPQVYVFDILIFHNRTRLQPEELWFYKILWEVKFKFDNLDERWG